MMGSKKEGVNQDLSDGTNVALWLAILFSVFTLIVYAFPGFFFRSKAREKPCVPLMKMPKWVTYFQLDNLAKVWSQIDEFSMDLKKKNCFCYKRWTVCLSDPDVATTPKVFL
jgi:hypothetical protein